MTKVYCGLDFHKNSTTICALDEKGNDIEMVKVATRMLIRYLANRKNYLIGIEASGGTNHVVEKLKADGHDVRIIDTVKFRAVGIGGKKTDERDARAIAEALRLNYIPEVHHKSLYARQIKSLIVGREMIVRSRVNMVNHVRGILREYGITMPQGYEHFRAEAASAIERVECGYIKEHLKDLLERIKDLSAREAELEEQLTVLAKKDKRVKRLRTVPGVGLMTAMTLIAVLDEVDRFGGDSKRFASYLGLVPRENSSGDKRRMGSITRSGSEILRRYLIHGARGVLMHALAAKRKKGLNRHLQWATALKHKSGMNKATVALAHKMARTCFAILRDEAEYCESCRSPKSKAKAKAA